MDLISLTQTNMAPSGTQESKLVQLFKIKKIKQEQALLLRRPKEEDQLGGCEESFSQVNFSETFTKLGNSFESARSNIIKLVR